MKKYEPLRKPGKTCNPSIPMKAKQMHINNYILNSKVERNKTSRDSTKTSTQRRTRRIKTRTSFFPVTNLQFPLRPRHRKIRKNSKRTS